MIFCMSPIKKLYIPVDAETKKCSTTTALTDNVNLCLLLLNSNTIWC